MVKSRAQDQRVSARWKPGIRVSNPGREGSSQNYMGAAYPQRSLPVTLYTCKGIGYEHVNGYTVMGASRGNRACMFAMEMG